MANVFIPDKSAGWCSFCKASGGHWAGCCLAPQEPDTDYDDEEREEYALD